MVFVDDYSGGSCNATILKYHYFLRNEVQGIGSVPSLSGWRVNPMTIVPHVVHNTMMQPVHAARNSKKRSEYQRSDVIQPSYGGFEESSVFAVVESQDEALQEERIVDGKV